MSKNILVKFAWSVMRRTRQSHEMNFQTRDHFERKKHLERANMIVNK